MFGQITKFGYFETYSLLDFFFNKTIKMFDKLIWWKIMAILESNLYLTKISKVLSIFLTCKTTYATTQITFFFYLYLTL